MTAVAASSLLFGCRACSHEPGASCSVITRSARSFSSVSVTSRARPWIIAERKFTEWWNSERA